MKMTHLFLNGAHSLSHTKLLPIIQIELMARYQIDASLAFEMALDFLNFLSAIDGDNA